MDPFAAKATKQGTKTISEAVREGLLLDVSEVAKKRGMLHPTFITPTLAARYDARWSDPEPGASLERELAFASDLLFEQEYKYKGIAMSSIDDVILLERDDDLGEVVLILETGRAEEIGLKRTTVGEHVM